MKLVVVGAGISGLAAAHRAVERAREHGRPLQLTLLEAADRVGGTIRTERRDGFLIECGPDSFLSEKPWALALCRRLRLEDRLVRTDDRFRRTFVAWRGRLHPLPEGFQLLAPTRLGPLLSSRLFSWRWHPGGCEPGEDFSHEPTTLVVFELEEVPGGTLLTVVESGFDQIPIARRARAFRDNEGGWTMQMEAIAKHLGRSA